MKKVLLSLALSASALLASAGCHWEFINGTWVEHCPTAMGTSELATMQTFKNDVIDHTNQIDFATKGEGAMAVDGTLSIGSDIHYVDVVPRYNPTGNLGFDVRLPIVRNGESDEMGIGDISTSANYHFGTLESEYGVNISTLRYIASTGDEDNGLGTGSGAIVLTHALAKDLNQELRVHGLLNYTHYMDDDYDDSIALMGGISHMGLLPNVAVANVKFTYFMEDKLSVADLWAELSSTNIVPGIPLSSGIKIPLIDSYDGSDLDKTFMIYVKAMGFFN